MIRKLHLDDIEQDDYTLIALHTILPGFRLAYLLNKVLKLQFIKNKVEHTLIKNQHEIGFTYFQYEDAKNFLTWKLIENKKEIQIDKNTTEFNLFETISNESQQYLLIPELNKTDFILKIEGDLYEDQQNNLIEKIKEVNYIYSAYPINQEQFKSKNNLIF